VFALAVLLSVQPAAAEVSVFAAASLKTALDELAAAWTKETGEAVSLSYGGSAALARQIASGAPADIFLPAAEEWMDAVDAGGLIAKDSRRDLLGNALVLVALGSVAPVEIDATLDLPGLLSEGRLSMGLVDAVPAGQYGREALQSLGLWDGVKDRLVQSENVRLALRLVELGEAPLGIVYASDAVDAPGVTVIGTFPETSHRPITYPAALVTGQEDAAAAAFLDYLETPGADAVFRAHGFRPLP
jgi:molybdate transport system substrate-binding protein